MRSNIAPINDKPLRKFGLPTCRPADVCWKNTSRNPGLEPDADPPYRLLLIKDKLKAFFLNSSESLKQRKSKQATCRQPQETNYGNTQFRPLHLRVISTSRPQRGSNITFLTTRPNDQQKHSRLLVWEVLAIVETPLSISRPLPTSCF